MPRFPAGQTLLIDADDTLWENNIYFERAIAAFISFLDHHEYSARGSPPDPQRSRARDHPLPRLRPLQLYALAGRLLRAPQPRARHRGKARAHSWICADHRRAGDRVAARRRRNPRRSFHAPPSHPDDQGQPRRAGRQAGALRARALFCRSGNSRREGSRSLPRRNPSPQHCARTAPG